MFNLFPVKDYQTFSKFSVSDIFRSVHHTYHFNRQTQPQELPRLLNPLRGAKKISPDDSGDLSLNQNVLKVYRLSVDLKMNLNHTLTRYKNTCDMSRFYSVNFCWDSKSQTLKTLFRNRKLF